MKQLSIFLFPLFLSFCSAPAKKETTALSILDFGAKGDSITLNTKAIQMALDQVFENGGGTVIIPPGNFISGTLFLRSNTVLHLMPGAKLLGSSSIEDYQEMEWGENEDQQPYHLIVIDSSDNVVIEGQGTIDGRGENFWQNSNLNPKEPQWILAKKKKVSPLIQVQNSKNIRLKDITVKTGGGWNVHILESDKVTIDGLRIVNDLYSPNSDGIDISGSFDVTVSNCYIHTCDDGVVIKTLHNGRECRRIAVSNCIIQTSCVALKLGTNQSYQNMGEVTFSNCVIEKSHRAIGLYTNKGGTLENVTCSNIIFNTNAPLVMPIPIHIMAEAKNEKFKAGNIRNVTISNFTGKTQGRILLTATDGARIENLILRDLQLEYPYIENFLPFELQSKSTQFPKRGELDSARQAKAVIVAQNINNLVVDNLIITWPKTTTVPLEWQHPFKLQNGILDKIKLDYNLSKELDFSVLWAKNINKGYLFSPLASPSKAGLKKYLLENSDITIKE